jgi:hypothetical protein
MKMVGQLHLSIGGKLPMEKYGLQIFMLRKIMQKSSLKFSGHLRVLKKLNVVRRNI